jgi:hypothetical protein
VKRASLFALVALVGCSGGLQEKADRPAEAKPAPLIKQPPQERQVEIIEEPIHRDRGVLLRMKFKPGASIKRGLSATIEYEAVDKAKSPPKLERTEMTTTYTTRVVSIEKGLASLAIDTAGLKVKNGSGGGEWVPEKGGEIKIDSQGRADSEGAGLVSSTLSIGFIVFPAGRLVKGDSWSTEGEKDMPPFGALRVKDTYTYLGLVGDEHKVAFSSVGSRLDLKAHGTYWYRASDLMLSRADLQQGAVIASPGSDGIKVRVRMNVTVRSM